MKTLQILGTGCPKCKVLAENTEAAAQRLGIPVIAFAVMIAFGMCSIEAVFRV